MSEPELARAEPAVWAYCRELCGPGECERAVAAALAALEDGGVGSIASENRLLLITRAAAAQFASDGRHGPASGIQPAPDGDPVCAGIPARLAARASGALEPGERRELDQHLSGCLVCKATEFKMNRAEREFAVMQGVIATLAAQPKPIDTTPEPRATRAAAAETRDARTARRAVPAETRRAPAPPPTPPPAKRAEPVTARATSSVPPPKRAAPEATHATPAAPGPLEAELGPVRAEAAVRAYCRELCGPAGSKLAIAASLDAIAGSSPANSDGLLRSTRLAAAERAIGHGKKSVGSRDCLVTPARLVARAGGELTPKARRELEEHIRQCIACQATEIKMGRAERAFATIAGIRVAVEPRLERIKARAAIFETPVPANERSVTADPPRARAETRPEPPPPPAIAAPAVEPADLAATKSRPVPVEPPAPAVEPPAEQQERTESIRPPSTKVAEGAIAAAATGAGAGTAAATPRKRGPSSGKTRQGSRRPAGAGKRTFVALAAAVLLLAAVAAALVLKVGSSSSSPKSAKAPVVTTAVPAAPKSITTAPPAAKPKPATRAPAKRHAAATKPHRAAKPKHKSAPAAPAAPVTPAPAAPVTPAAAVAPVVVTPTPTPTPVAAAPVAPTPSNPAPAKPSSPSVTPVGSNLPAQNAPTQGITPSGH